RCAGCQARQPDRRPGRRARCLRCAPRSRRPRGEGEGPCGRHHARHHDGSTAHGGGRHIDLRVVTLPSVHGESIVMRILDKDSVVMKLEKLGMADTERERFERAFHETHGAVLVTGPTGSGKSTTLYAALLALNTP